MKQHKLMGAIAFSGALALALAGCASDSGNNGGEGEGDGASTVTGADYNPQPRENLQEGGEVIFPISDIPTQLNAFHGDGSSNTARIAAWYMPQVMLQDVDGTPYKNDAYLDEWKIEEVDGNTQITFTFTEEAHWNDGTDMDWKSIEATWLANRSYDEGFTPNATDGYKSITSVEQGDTPKTAIVTFDGIFAWPEMPFLTGIVHPALADPAVFNEAFIDNLNPQYGAGPYTVTDFDLNGGEVTLEPNPEWWGNAPLLDKVTWRQLDTTAAINAFKNGEIDQVETQSADSLAQVADMEGVVTYRAQSTATALLEVDSEKPNLSDVKVREALFTALNREQVKEVVWNGLDYTEEPAGSLTLFSFQPGYVDALAETGREDGNVEKAKELLDEAGWVEGEDGVREKDGEKLTVVFPVHGDSATVENRGKVIQQQLNEVGFDVQLEIRPSADFSDDYTSKNWDMMFLAFTSSDPFGAAWFCQLYCSDSGLNLSGTGTPEMDERIHSEVESLPTAEEQTAAAMELETEIFQSWGIIPMYNGPFIVTAKEGLANLTPESYVGLDLFGVLPVENVGWEK
ncbi:ABC transporter family substrate-binding protein [Microbacterium sp. CIAB417]|uniref:ABC transporter family substrate-binding protein n=1 Tax=Microbacterium sp. CIAB417 TaxID=2860287 RepID=UPI001FAB4FB8|nr:ABC transporter family substrate-binding protein [Microbacterium sp. CIAB417]